MTSNKKGTVHLNDALCGSGGGIRTRDLRVMSPVSYQLLHPAI